MPVEKRTQAALAFWNDHESPEIQMQHVEALAMLARRLNFRAKSVQALPVERRARHLGQLPDVPDTIATRALIAYHFANQRPLMSAFLTALGIQHEEGLIKDEDVPAPSREQLAEAVASVRANFDSGDLDLYLRTLATLDAETWANVDGLLPSA